MKTNNTQYKLLLFFASIILLSIISAYFSIMTSSIDCSENCDLVIFKNENAFDIGHRLDTLGLVDNYYSFVLAAKLLSVDRDLKPGHYNLNYIKNMKQLLIRLTIPDRDYVKITIPEGWTIEQIGSILEQNNLVDATKFNLLCNNVLFIESLGFENLNSLEGFLFPETYFLSEDQNEKEIIQMMINQFNKIMKHEELIFYKDRFNNINELITLASIIQGEAGNENEMSKISSVFNNRLNQNMKLAADITIKYALNEDRMLIDKDFDFEENEHIKNHLYNTYTHKGLPPGPINNPGFSAIKAAIYPDSTEYLFFVLKSKDSREHVFSKTKEQHHKARSKYMDSKRK